MSTINLTYKVTEGDCPCNGWNLNIRTPFDADDYAEFHGINRAEIDADDIKAVQDAQSQLGGDFWLTVDYE